MLGRVEWNLTTWLFLGVSHPLNDCIIDLTLVLYQYTMLLWWLCLWVHDATTISKMAVVRVMFWTGFIWIHLTIIVAFISCFFQLRLCVVYFLSLLQHFFYKKYSRYLNQTFRHNLKASWEDHVWISWFQLTSCGTPDGLTSAITPNVFLRSVQFC